jgi:hypothetical protein
MVGRKQVLGVLVALAHVWGAGCASVEAPILTAADEWAMAQRPSQAQCAAVRDIDLRALARRQAEGTPALAQAGQALEVVAIPDWAERRPPEDASVVIRARMPPGGGHGTDHRAVVWREADGRWWYWKQVLGGPPTPPPPPPTGVERDSAEWRAWEAMQPRPGMSMDDRQYPPRSGPVEAARAAVLEAAWTDPCRAWDPDWWPVEAPLNRSIDGMRTRLCAQDSSSIHADITENGARRLVGGACINATPTYRLIEAAIYVGGV